MQPGKGRLLSYSSIVKPKNLRFAICFLGTTSKALLTTVKGVKDSQVDGYTNEGRLQRLQKS